MELIKVIFFAIGTFFGVENSIVMAEKTNVSIDTKTQTITINQNNLFTIIRNEQDSIKVAEQLYRISNQATEEERYQWREEFNDYKLKTLDITTNKEKKQLDISIKLKYNTSKDLKVFAIDYVEAENSYAIINIESWNIDTDKGELKGNYWYFKDDISFSMSPAATMPEQYKPLKKDLYTFWKMIKP